MSNYCEPFFYRIDFDVIPSYIKLPCINHDYEKTPDNYEKFPDQSEIF